MILQNPVLANEGDMLTPLEKWTSLLQRQETVRLLWECYMRGNLPRYVSLFGSASCDAPPPGGVRRPVLWAPNSRNLGIVNGWTLDQIANEWNATHGTNNSIPNAITNLYAAGAPDRIGVFSAVVDGLFLPDTWPMPQRAKYFGLPTWFVYRATLDAQDRTRQMIASLTPVAGSITGRAPWVPPASKSFDGAAWLASWQAQPTAGSSDPWATIRQWRDPVGTAPSASSNTGGNFGLDASAGNMTIGGGGGGGGGAASPQGNLMGDTTRTNVRTPAQLVNELRAGNAVFDLSRSKNYASTEGSKAEVVPETPAPVDVVVNPPEETGVILPDGPGTEIGIAETQVLARRVYASPADTAVRIIEDQSRPDLQRALLAGAASAPAWQNWAGEAWRSETIAAMGRTAYDAVGGDWGALVASFALAGVTQAQYMQWLLQVIEIVRTRLQSAPKKSKKGGMAWLVPVGAAVAVGIAVMRK